jgi:hypothetical protein
METAKKNFRRLMQFLKSQDYIEITTFNDLMDRYSYQKDIITKQELKIYAEKVLKSNRVVIEPYFSAAEMFEALTGSLNEYLLDGTIPAKHERISLLGPMEIPDTVPGISMITADQAGQLVREANSWIMNNGYLPARLAAGDNPVGTGSLLALFSQMYLDIQSGHPKESYQVLPFDPWPKENEQKIIAEVKGCKDWPVHKPDLDMSNLVQMTRLQLWTLKPAREN